MNKTIPARDFCSSVFDGTHDTPKPCKHGHPLILSKNIQGNCINLQDTYNISEEDYNAINMRSKVSQWDILFSMIGTVGSVYLEKNEDIPYAIKNMGVFSTKDELKAKWLYYYLHTNEAKSIIANYLNGAVQKFLPLGFLREFPVKKMPQNASQIISVLENIDAKIENNNAICAELEAMAKLLYDYWFVQFDFPDENGKPYKSSGGKMVWSEELKREIPEGWEIATLEKYIKVIRGVAFDPEDIATIATEGYTPLLKSNNLQDGKLLLDDIVYVKSSKVSHEQHLRKGSIFITMSSGSTEHVGKTAVISYDTPYCYGAFCSKIEIHPNYRAFLSVFFRSDYFSRIIRTIVVGTSIKNINNNHLINNALPLPPANVLERYEQIVCPMLDQQGAIVQENQELACLRDFLLPLLMNGQVGFSADN